HTRTATHFVYERLELCALVVPNDDSTRLQFVSKLLRHVVVKRVHQACPPSAAAALLRRPPLLRPEILPLASDASRRLFSADFTARDVRSFTSSSTLLVGVLRAAHLLSVSSTQNTSSRP